MDLHLTLDTATPGTSAGAGSLHATFVLVEAEAAPYATALVLAVSGCVEYRLATCGPRGMPELLGVTFR